jgi:hypothetical protein
MSYQSPSAFRAAITARAKVAARTSSRSPKDFIDHFALSRLLARVFRADTHRWVLKGDQAMLVRYPDARHSKDIDLLYRDATPKAAYDEALAALRAAASTDLGDYMTFEYVGCTEPADNNAGINVTFKAMLGTTQLAHVSVDVVVDHQPVGHVVTAALTPVLSVTGLNDWPDIQLYPIVDHVADKICAMIERHGPHGHGSTRFRDLVDLVLIILREEIDGMQLHTVLRTEIDRRRRKGTSIELPEHFAVPDAESWTSGYAKQAANVDNLGEFTTLESAEKLGAAFVDPLLSERAPGTWSPTALAWR